MKTKFLPSIFAAVIFACGCTTARVGKMEPRTGDEIVAAGQFFHTGTRVVLWLDPGGYDAYRTERRFAPIEKSDWKTSSEEIKTLTTPATACAKKISRPTSLNACAAAAGICRCCKASWTSLFCTSTFVA